MGNRAWDLAIEADMQREIDELKTQRADLLAALKGCVGYLAGLPMAYRPDDAWFKPASAAIAKAEGTE